MALLFVIVLGLLSTIEGAPAPAPPPTPAPAPAFVKVSYQWPMAYCHINKCTVEREKISDTFTLHGVWPTTADNQQMTFCKTSYEWSWTAVRNIKGLTSVWRSFIEKDQVFLTREWKKHGTCSNLPLVEYFESSLKLFKSKSIKQALAASAINPSSSTDMKGLSTPTVNAIHNAIAQNVGVRPIVVCGNDRGSVYLVEVRLCAKMDFKTFIDCPGNAFVECGDDSEENPAKVLFYRDPKNLD